MIHRYAMLAGIALANAAPLAAQTAQFDPARLSSHVQTLSADAFEGRAPATPGETKTVAYLVDQFAKAGLQPGGEIVNGQRQWTQRVPLLQSDIAGTPHLEFRTPRGAVPLTQGEQISVRSPLNGQKQVAVNGGEVKVRIKDNAPAIEITPAAPKAPRGGSKPKAKASKRKAEPKAE